MSVFNPPFPTSPKALAPVSTLEQGLSSAHGGDDGGAIIPIAPQHPRLSQPNQQRSPNRGHSLSDLLGKNGGTEEGLSLHTLLSRSNPRARGQVRPQKAAKGSSSWQLKQFADATLGSGSLKKAVQLPEGEDENEWVAVNSQSTTNDCFHVRLPC